jgi:hypothetical protein
MRWSYVVLLAAVLCVGCSSIVHYTSSASDPVPTSASGPAPASVGPPAASAGGTGPIPSGQCTDDDRLIAGQFQGWQQAGYPMPSDGLVLLADDAIAAATGDGVQEPGGVGSPDAQALLPPLRALLQEAPVAGYSAGPSYGQDLATVKADAAWWATCS